MSHDNWEGGQWGLPIPSRGVDMPPPYPVSSLGSHTDNSPPHIYTSPIRQDELISSCYILQVLEKADRNKVTLEISPSRNCPENGKYKHLTYAR